MRHLTAIPRLATWLAAIAATFAVAPAVAHARAPHPSKARHHRRSSSRPALINPNDPSTWPAGFNPNDPSTYPPITHTATSGELRRLLAPNPARRYASMNSLLDPAFPCRGARQLRPIFIAAAQSFQLRWQILAGIAEIETRDGCDLTTSSAGAVGWTQFMPATWREWGMDADGDGIADPNDAVDAIFSAARYLRSSGAPGNYYRAIFAYNHADWYVREVLSAAGRYH